MASAGALVVVACNEADTRVDPSRYFNLSASTTRVIKTPGGRTTPTVNNIYYADQANRIGMIIVVQHTSCSSTTGNVEANIRSDIQALRDSPHVRNDISIIGYVLELETGQLREVNVPRSALDDETKKNVLSQMQDFGPFWS